jgi:drug/metabolite transporter (DMT)-like permease
MLPAVSPDVLWGVLLASVSMLAYVAATLSVPLAVRRGMSSGPGAMLAAAAGVPTGVLLILVQLAWSPHVAAPSLWAVCAFAVAGIFSTYLGRWLMFRSIETIGPSGTAGLQSSSPLITAVLGWLFLGETLGAVGLFGLALGITGIAAMSIGLGQAQREPAAVQAAGPLSRQRGFILGSVLVGLAGASAYSGGHVFRAIGIRTWDEPLLGAAIGAVAGLLVLLAAGGGKLAGYALEIRANPAAARIYAGVGVMQFAAQALVIAAMKYIPASVAALISMCTPLVVMPFSYFVLRKIEKLTWATVLGVCVTLAGVALVVLYGPKGGH